MSKRLDVLTAVLALVKRALPHADVLGLNGEDAAPDRLAPGGLAVVRSGDPGDPEVTLSPVTYSYDHQIPLELAAYKSDTMTAEQVVDDMVGLISAEIEADRELGGLVDYLDAFAPTTDDDFVTGGSVPRRANAVIVASYSTTNPL